MRESILKGDILVADVEELEKMDASEIYARRLNAKEVLMPKNGELVFPFAGGNTVGRERSGIPKFHFLARGEEHNDVVQGESDGSPLSDQQADDADAWHDFWSFSGNHIYRHHFQERVVLHVPKEGSFPRDHEDLIAEKGFNSWSHYNLVHKPVSTLQAIKMPNAKATVDKEWEKLEKLPAWQATKVKNKKEVIGKAQKEGKTVLFCHIDGSLSLQELGYTGRVVLRGDVVKDDSGSYAVFTEQGSSASQMTAAKVLDVIARLPRCAGHASDAASGYAHVKSEPVVPLERNLCGHPLAALLSERQCEKILLHKWMRESTKLGMSVRPSPTRIILIRKRGRLQNGREKQNLELVWTILMNKLDLEKPTPFLDQISLGCTQREYKANQNLDNAYRKLFALRISAGAQKSCKILETNMYLRGPTTRRGMRKHALKDTANWEIKESSNFKKSPHFASTITSSSRKNWNRVNFSHNPCRQSAQYLRSSRRLV